MGTTKPIDILKTALSTLVLVLGAVGSLWNFVHGSSMPFLLSFVAIIVILLIILAEVRAAKSHAGLSARACEREMGHAPEGGRRSPSEIAMINRQTQPENARDHQTAQDGLYFDASGRMVIRAVRIMARDAGSEIETNG